MTLLILPLIIIPIAALMLIIVENKKNSQKILVASTLINLLIILSIFISSVASGTVNLAESYPYIKSLGIFLGLRINIISLILLIMSSVVLFATALSGNSEHERPKMSAALITLFQIASVGLFTSSNLFLFFIFWDVGVIALFLMINILGSANRKVASINFLIFEILSSSLLLLGILLIYFYTPVHSFDIQYITANAASIPPTMQTIIFIILFAAFMINMPIFPAHFWLPDAHTEASTQGSMLLSGILTKFGAFGMLLLFGMLPIAANYAVYIAILAGISLFYSVFILMRQTDLKRIIAYSTIVEMGIIMLGISAGNSFGSYGATYLMLAHGLTIALMFLTVGVIKHIFGERNIFAIKGTIVNAKSTTYAFFIGVLAMIGFPLTASFIADILLFIGVLQTFGILGMLPILALILMGAFLYFVISKSMFSSREHSKIVELVTLEEKIGYVFLISIIFIFGIFPFAILSLIKI